MTLQPNFSISSFTPATRSGFLCSVWRPSGVSELNRMYVGMARSFDLIEDLCSGACSGVKTKAQDALKQVIYQLELSSLADLMDSCTRSMQGSLAIVRHCSARDLTMRR